MFTTEQKGVDTDRAIHVDKIRTAFVSPPRTNTPHRTVSPPPPTDEANSIKSKRNIFEMWEKRTTGSQVAPVPSPRRTPLRKNSESANVTSEGDSPLSSTAKGLPSSRRRLLKEASFGEIETNVSKIIEFPTERRPVDVAEAVVTTRKETEDDKQRRSDFRQFDNAIQKSDNAIAFGKTKPVEYLFHQKTGVTSEHSEIKQNYCVSEDSDVVAATFTEEANKIITAEDVADNVNVAANIVMESQVSEEHPVSADEHPVSVDGKKSLSTEKCSLNYQPDGLRESVLTEEQVEVEAVEKTDVVKQEEKSPIPMPRKVRKSAKRNVSQSSTTTDTTDNLLVSNDTQVTEAREAIADEDRKTTTTNVPKGSPKEDCSDKMSTNQNEDSVLNSRHPPSHSDGTDVGDRVCKDTVNAEKRFPFSLTQRFSIEESEVEDKVISHFNCTSFSK